MKNFDQKTLEERLKELRTEDDFSESPKWNKDLFSKTLILAPSILFIATYLLFNQNIISLISLILISGLFILIGLFLYNKMMN